MIVFRDRFAAVLLAVCCAAPAFAQAPQRPDDAESAQAPDASEPEAVDDSERPVAGSSPAGSERPDRLVRQIRPYLEGMAPDALDRDPAIDSPIPIQPTPYIPPQLLSFWQEGEPVTESEADRDEAPAPDESLPERDPFAEEGAIAIEEPFPADSETESAEEMLVEEVETGSLSELDPASLGILRPDSGGLPIDIWQGSSRPVIAELLRRLPVGQPSPVINEMLERLLLSAVEIPPAESEEASDILAIRIEKLAETGKLDLLLSFLAQIGPGQESERVRLVRVNAYLLDGNVDGACSVARGASAFDANPEWIRILAFCDAEAGEETRALRSVELLEETGAAPPGFRALIEALLFEQEGDAASVLAGSLANGDLAELTPLYIALFAQLGEPPPIEIIESSRNRLVAAGYATRSDIPPDRRLPVAAEAARNGYYASESLGQLLMALDYTDADNPTLPVAAAGSEDGVSMNDDADPMIRDLRGDGYLLLSSYDAADIFDEAEILGLLWRRIVAGGRAPIMAGALAERISARDPGEWPNSFQRVVVSTALYTGRREMAERSYRWLQLAADGIDLGAARELSRIWPLVVASGIDPRLRYRERDAELWWRGLMQLSPDARGRQATIAFGMMEALGYTIPQALWDRILLAPAPASEAAPPLGIWRQLLIAGDEARTGETLALSAIALGDQGPVATGSTILSAALGALRAVGLREEARRIAIEAMVGHGVGLNP